MLMQSAAIIVLAGCLFGAATAQSLVGDPEEGVEEGGCRAVMADLRIGNLSSAFTITPELEAAIVDAVAKTMSEDVASSRSVTDLNSGGEGFSFGAGESLSVASQVGQHWVYEVRVPLVPSM